MSARARVLRYGLLEEHRRAAGCSWIATAHQAEDQMETLAMRLNRGAGLAGLVGIRGRRGEVVRPLLGGRRVDLAAIVTAAGLRPVIDPTNSDDRFDRARLRKSLSLADWLDRDRWGVSAAALAESEDALAWLVRRLGGERIERVGCGLRLTLADDPPEVVRRLVTHCLSTVAPSAVLRGGEVRSLTERLGSAARRREALRATLAGVMVTSSATEDGVVAVFSAAPPRRAARPS